VAESKPAATSETKDTKSEVSSPKKSEAVA
jgi:hypothetical protein